MNPKDKSQDPKILVVEGYLNQSKSILSHLEELDMSLTVVSAHDAEAAVEYLDKQAVSLLIIDVYLKGQLDGFDLCRTIRSSQVNQKISIILLLGGHLSLERSRGISAGADLLLHRPVVKEELFKMVQLLLEWKFNQETGPATGTAEGRSSRRLHSVS